MRTCVGSVSYILPGSECAGFEFHPFSATVQGDLLKFVKDSTALNAFEALPLRTFWSKMRKSYPQVAEVPVRVPLMFLSKYICEQGFLAMFCVKIKLISCPTVHEGRSPRLLSKEAIRRILFKLTMWRVYRRTTKDEDCANYEDALNAATTEITQSKRRYEKKIACNISNYNNSFLCICQE